MKRIISYMVKYRDGSFEIKNDKFEKIITETNIQLFLADKEEEEIKDLNKIYTNKPSYININVRCYFISITTLDQ